MSRRTLLAATGALGAGGFATGYSGAWLSDEESVRHEFTAGMLDLEVAWEDGGRFDLSPGDSGSRRVTLDLPQDERRNNPAYLWFRTHCPTFEGLANALDVTLRYVSEDTNDGGDDSDDSDDSDGGDDDSEGVIFEGTLCEFADRYNDGGALDAEQRVDVAPEDRACLDTEEMSPVILELAWELDELVKGDAETETFDFELEFAAISCRHEDGTTSPFESAGSGCSCPSRHGISNVSLYQYVDGTDGADGGECLYLGKLDLDEIGGNLAGNAHPLDDTDDYEIDVSSTTEKGDGETVAMAFEVTSTDGSDPPTLCQAVVKGGPDCTFYGPDDFVGGNATRGEFVAPIVDNDSPNEGGVDNCQPTGGEN